MKSERLDAHQHFWKYSPAEYPWIPPGSPLHRDWLPEDLALEQAQVQVGGSIAVQARQSLEETRWLLHLAEKHPQIHGVVGWVDLCAQDVEQQLVEFTGTSKFVGVRHVAQDEPDDFLLREDLRNGIAALHSHRLVYDLLIYPRQLSVATQLAAAFPQQTFVLDHMAKPPIRERDLTAWSEQLRALARLPNVWCKISGLITEADHQHWKPADLLPCLDAALAAFGEDRVMWGSDWPVCLLAGSYRQTLSIVEEYCRHLAPSSQEAIFGGNARAVYRRPENGPTQLSNT